MRRPYLVLAFLFCCFNFAFAANDRYWQQHVSYDIRVTLFDSIHTIEGTLRINYTNNSPDTLNEIYFHLYSNAFQPGSMMDVRSLAVGTPPIYDRITKMTPSQEGRYWINTVMAEEQPAKYEITGTIMRVALSKSLAPNASLTLSMPFREQIPLQTRRSGWMSREGVEYSMAQWYPKICEYDVEGWHHQEYIAHEFYGVWGDFHVEITLPARFTVGASGQCQNPTDVGHGYERIAGGEKQGTFIPLDNAPGMLTWKFDANNVHDFAWVADDDYVHQWTTWRDSITIHSFYKTTVAEFWKKSLEYTERSLEIYSDTFGPYPYHNFSTTMAGDGGMEYPQLIMITGYRPNPLSLAGVIAHEVGHQWFYGMLGSNETREAFMDEGFTSYATTIAMQGMYGENQIVPGVERSWLDWFIPKTRNKSDNYRGYQPLAVSGYEEPLDIPHDWLREPVTEGQVYGKTQAILNMLQYTLGDSVFGAGMKNYYWQWRFKHPHLVDFKRVMENTAHTDLDWFFDEWFRSTRTVDYVAKDVCTKRTANGYENTLRLHNNELGVMPVDLLLHFHDGSTSTATIPLATNKDRVYHKSGETLFLPEWDWVAKDYKGSITTQKPISWFEIDTSWRLQDLHWLNNYSSRSGLWLPPGEWALWKQLFLSPPWDRYYSVVRPIIGWSIDPHVAFDFAGLGSKFGMNNGFSGDVEIMYKATPQKESDSIFSANPYNHVEGSLIYSQPVDWLGRLSSVRFQAEKIDGIPTLRGSLSKTFRPEYLFVGATQSATLQLESQNWWPLSTDVAQLRYSIVARDPSTRFDLFGETSILKSDVNFQRFKAKYETEIPVTSNMSWHLRFVGGSATQNTPIQRQFSMTRANEYETHDDRFFRNMTGQSDRIHFVEGGADVHEVLDEDILGLDMLGANFDLGFPNYLYKVWRPFEAISTGIYADAGWIGNSVDHMFRDISKNTHAAAGLKFSFNWLSWLPWQLRGVLEEYAQMPPISIYWPIYADWSGRPNVQLSHEPLVTFGYAF